MYKRPALIGFLLLLCCLFLPQTLAADATVSFSDINMVGGQFWVYSYNGTLMGIYNTTDTGVLIPDQAIIVLKPSPVDYFKNPLLYPAFILSLIGPVGAVFLVIFAVAAMWFVFFRRR